MSISTGARKKALVVGISDYTNLQKLDFCRNDGKGVYDVLTSLGYEISDKNKLIGSDPIFSTQVCKQLQLKAISHSSILQRL